MEASLIEPVTLPSAPAKARVSAALRAVVFYSLLGLFVITAIPYGTAEAWWKAFFVCAASVLAIAWLIEGYLSGTWIQDGRSVLAPIAALIAFALIQSITYSSGSSAGIATQTALSVDPYQTRFFAFQILGLLFCGIFLFNYAHTERRWRILINVIIALAIASAIFGILRQTTQTVTGFGLPLIGRNQGYGQFINKNHFAYFMEMALGLGLGLIVGGGVKRDQGLLYLASMLPLWSAIVLSGSRGGLVAMTAQLFVAALLYGFDRRHRYASESESRVVRLLESRTFQIAMTVILLLSIGIGTIWLGGDKLAAQIADARNELSIEIDESRLAVNRNEIWKVTLRMFAANPLVGVGMGSYWAAVPAYHDASGRMTPQEAHNDYLELIASGGLVAAAIFIWFVVALARKTRANLRSSNRFRRAACFGAVIAIAGVGTHSLFDFGLHMIANALVFIALIVLATATPAWAVRGIRHAV